jgi:hypothetical protein
VPTRSAHQGTKTGERIKWYTHRSHPTLARTTHYLDHRHHLLNAKVVMQRKILPLPPASQCPARPFAKSTTMIPLTHPFPSGCRCDVLDRDVSDVRQGEKRPRDHHHPLVMQFTESASNSLIFLSASRGRGGGGKKGRRCRYPSHR